MNKGSSRFLCLVLGQGFEPQLTESESAVLPLDEPRMVCRRRISRSIAMRRQASQAWYWCMIAKVTLSASLRETKNSLSRSWESFKWWMWRDSNPQLAD